MRVLTRRGSAFEASLTVPAEDDDAPADLAGLVSWLPWAAVLGTEADPDRGTPPFTRALLAGGSLNVISDGARIGWRVAGPADARAPLLKLLRDLAARPRFSATRVQAEAERWRQRHDHRQGPYPGPHRAVEWAAGLALGKGRPVLMRTPDEVLARLHREDIRRLHERLFVPASTTLSITEPAGAPGPRSSPLEGVAERFRDWHGAHSAGLPEPQIPQEPPNHCARRTLGPGAYQAWLSAPVADSALFVGIEVPGRWAPGRWLLAGWIEWSELTAPNPDIRSVMVDDGRRSALVIQAAGPPDAREALIHSWLEGLIRRGLDEPSRVERLIQWMRRAAWAPEDGAELRASAQQGVGLAATLRDPARRFQLGVGPPEARSNATGWDEAVEVGPIPIVCDGLCCATER